METGSVIKVIEMQCPPELEEEWNTWYNEKHVPQVIKFKGFKRATRYKIAYGILGDEGKYPNYLTVYEFENRQAAEAYEPSPEHSANRADFDNDWARRGVKIKRRVHYEFIETWQK